MDTGDKIVRIYKLWRFGIKVDESFNNFFEHINILYDNIECFRLYDSIFYFKDSKVLFGIYYEEGTRLIHLAHQHYDFLRGIFLSFNKDYLMTPISEPLLHIAGDLIKRKNVGFDNFSHDMIYSNITKKIEEAYYKSLVDTRFLEK